MFTALMGTCCQLIALDNYGALGDFGLGCGLCRVDMADDTACSTKCSQTVLTGNEMLRHFSAFPKRTVFLLSLGVCALVAPFLPKWVSFDLIGM